MHDIFGHHGPDDPRRGFGHLRRRFGGWPVGEPMGHHDLDPRAAHPGPPFPPGGFRGFPGGHGHPFPFGFPGFAGVFGGPARGGRRGHGPGGRQRRGNVRAAILALLTERPMHGYEMIQEISERSGGFWRPSPGSVYPTLQLLADEGLVSAEDGTSGKRLFSLTDQGRSEAGKQDATPPWDQSTFDVDPREMDLRAALGHLATAVVQVSQAGSSSQKAKAVKALTEVRQQLYLILAEVGVDPDAGPDADADGGPDSDPPSAGQPS